VEVIEGSDTSGVGRTVGVTAEVVVERSEALCEDSSSFEPDCFMSTKNTTARTKVTSTAIPANPSTC